jgi:flagellar assembly protein FliH
VSAEPQTAPPHTEWRTVERPDLRRGVWTRLGDERVLGDDATEAVLGRLAERARSAAQAQGYAVGWAQGQEAAQRRAAEEAAAVAAEHERREQARAAEHAAALAALTRAAAALVAASEEIATRIGQQATDLAFEVTRTLLGHELGAVQDPGAAVVARVLAVLPPGQTATVRVHPRAGASPVTAELEAHGVRLVMDPTLSVHDAVVETDDSAVDLRLSEALGRLREVLS